MNAFMEIVRFECRYQLRSPLFIIVASVFFLMTFLGMASDAVQIGGNDSALNLNSNFAIIQTQLVFSVIGMFPAIAFVANAITRDFEVRTAEVLFASGVRPKPFVLGRFIGGTVFAMLTGFAALLGTLVGTLAPWLDPERIGEFTLSPYAFTLLVLIIPNYFFVCATFFTLAALFRSMAAAYGAALVFIVGYGVLTAFGGPEDLWWAVYADPFGGTAFGEVFRYATVHERNFELPQLLGDNALLANRALWSAVGLLCLAVTAWRYRFALNGPSRKKKSASDRSPHTFDALTVTVAHPRLLDQFLSQLRMDYRGVLRSAPFYILLAMGMLNVTAVIFGSTSLPYDTNSYPVTSLMLRAIEGAFLFFVLMIVVYYAGELVYRERSSRVADILDATPYANGVIVTAKIVALWSIIATLLLMVMLTSISIQLSLGFTELQPLLYLTDLFIINGLFFALLAVLAVFVTVLTGNRWLGMLGMILVFLGTSAAESFGFEHNLYLFSTPNTVYSDLNGYGHFFAPWAWFTLYWAVFCVILVLVSHLLFPRGHVFTIHERLKLASARASGSVRIMLGFSVIALMTTGAWIFYNTNVLNEYRIEDDFELGQAEYEKKYRHYLGQPLPQADSIEATVDIFPEERRLRSAGTVVLRNTHDKPINAFAFTVNPLLDIEKMEVAGASITESDEHLGHYLLTFNPPLPTGATTIANYTFEWRNPGFVNSRPNNRIVENGTFVDSTEILPVIGYDPSRELKNNNKRRDHDLPPVVRMAKLGDPAWLGSTQFGVSQRTDFKVTISTSPDQIAIAPGYLHKEWRANGRRYFEYAMDAPIWPFFSFMSARYEVRKDHWNDVALEVYHHPAHAWNVDVMMNSAKKSIDYFSREFSPYQYRQFRIIEFPRYATFAQSFPNTIPFSESIGFITDVRDRKDINLTFYVTAHEMAHQWWGHQVVGADMQGATVIVETLAQYSALMVMEKEYGADYMRRFIKFEMDSYLSSRGGELIEELPLLLTENQPYLHYRKGSVVMYALRNEIGETNLNRALKHFLNRFAFKSAPFPTAQDLLDDIRACAPAESQALITDLFERITLYDLEVTDAKVVERDGKQQTTITIEASKFTADGKGVESASLLDQWVDIALLPQADPDIHDNVLPRPLVLERHRLVTGKNKVRIDSTSRPVRVVVDPYLKLIDRKPDNNIWTL
jgi:ABC-2 type transport system permease protein